MKKFVKLLQVNLFSAGFSSLKIMCSSAASGDDGGTSLSFLAYSGEPTINLLKELVLSCAAKPTPTRLQPTCPSPNFSFSIKTNVCLFIKMKKVMSSKC